MVTIKEVAERAGVSVTTVSRVLNNKSMVATEKLEKVQEAIRALEYFPTPRRKKSKGDTPIVMVAISSMIDEALEGISDGAHKYGYDIMLTYASGNFQNLDSMFRYLERGIVEGVILFNYNKNMDEIKKISGKYPLVECGNCADLPDCCTVSIDDELASYEMTSHFIALGKRRIAFVGPSFDALFAAERRRGYRRALYEHDIPFDPEMVFTVSDYSYESGVEAAGRILNTGLSADAIICPFDTTAAGCLSVLKRRGIRVPGQIALSGFDSTEISDIVEPKITTVAQPFYQMGYQSVRELYARIQNGPCKGKKIHLSHELLIRKSTQA